MFTYSHLCNCRFCYVHLIDLSPLLVAAKPESFQKFIDFPKLPRQILKHNFNTPLKQEQSNFNQEISFQSYRRLTSKINGLIWSSDGLYLYVATNRRVVMYQLVSEVESLKEKIIKEFWKKKLMAIKGQADAAGGTDGGHSSIISNSDIEFVSEFEREWRENQQWNPHWK